MPVDRRGAYQEAIVRAAAPDASYFVLTFDRAGHPDNLEGSPAQPVTADELRAVVSKHWIIDDIRAARMHADIPDGYATPEGMEFRAEPNGRKSMRAWLLSAHLT